MTPQLLAIKAILKADIIAKSAAGQPLNGLGEDAIAVYYNAASASIVWRTDVTRAEIYHQTSNEGTTWNWTTYKSQSVTEQNAWTQMFMGDVANFSLPNLRAGVDAIFSGAGASAAQRAHVAAIAKRAARRVEALATNPIGGTMQTPSVLTFEGTVSAQDISDVMNLP
jgi:hypothetical protein